MRDEQPPLKPAIGKMLCLTMRFFFKHKKFMAINMKNS